MVSTKNNQNFWLFDKTHIGAGGPGGGGKGGQAGIMIGRNVGESSEHAIVFSCSSAILTDSGIPERTARVANSCLTLSWVIPPPFNCVPLIVAVSVFVRESEVGVIVL
jgi:hypothetical protein